MENRATRARVVVKATDVELCPLLPAVRGLLYMRQKTSFAPEIK